MKLIILLIVIEFQLLLQKMLVMLWSLFGKMKACLISLLQNFIWWEWMD